MIMNVKIEEMVSGFKIFSADTNERLLNIIIPSYGEVIELCKECKWIIINPKRY